MFLVRFLHVLALAVWLGGMAVLGAVVAPSTFQVLQAREGVAGRVLAGAVFGTALDRFQFVAYACAAVVLVTLGLMALAKTRASNLAVRAAIATALLVISLYAGLSVYPEVDRVQAAIGADMSPSTLEATDARRVRFDALHERSTTLMQINLVGTLALLAWCARDGRA
ncbi:MAG: DUF4149 domain-containing protein [Vicinamibacterales bacterium]|nr:DUF4149 domain-containing protein [Vicinamibacterales bacterium]